MNFGRRIKAERVAQQMSQIDLALKAGLPRKNGQQVVQKIEDRDSSRTKYAAALAKALGVHVNWALTGEGPKWLMPRPDNPDAVDYVPKTSSGLLGTEQRARIGNRIFSEMQRTGRTLKEVSARLHFEPADFEERAKACDFSLEDLAELVLFLGNGASLDFIVLGRFPVGDTAIGKAGEIIRGLQKPEKRKSKT
jgi:transcriptional regulator with XRE-family HTH domain